MVDNAGKRYAEAIYEIATDEKKVFELYTFLKDVKDVYSNNDMKQYLNHPLVKKEDKVAMLEKIFADQKELERNIVLYLEGKNRLRDIDSIYEEYKKIYYTHENIIDVKATFATEVSDEQKKALVEKLTKSTGKKVNLEVEVDATLIGGGIIRIGDKVIDGTIKNRLGEMSRA